MNPRSNITVNSKPSQVELKYWYDNGTVVSFTQEDGRIHHGKITSYQPMGTDTLIWVEGSNSAVYLRDIKTYSFTPKESIFIDAKSDSAEKVGLVVGDKTFWVDKTILSDRVDYFKAMFFRTHMKEAEEKRADLSDLLSPQEAEIFFSRVDADHCYDLTLKQAQIFLEAATKLSAVEWAEKAQARIDEFTADFFWAVRNKDYKKMSDLFNQGADINSKFDKFAINKMDGFVNDCPNDTPLTFAVRSEDFALTEYLLRNRANTEVYYKQYTPLMEASSGHRPALVKLLLEKGANPNTSSDMSGFGKVSAMHMVFLSIQEWLVDERAKSTSEIVGLLLANGSTETHDEIANILKKNKRSDQIIALFEKIWKEQSDIHQVRKKDAVSSSSSEKLSSEGSAYPSSFISSAERRLSNESLDESKTNNSNRKRRQK